MSKRKLTGRTLDALPAEEKERIYREIDESPPGKIWADSKPLTAADRKRFERIKKKLGRPKIGKGTRVVSVTVEVDLLKRADAFAADAGLKRSELFTHGLRTVLG